MYLKTDIVFWLWYLFLYQDVLDIFLFLYFLFLIFCIFVTNYSSVYRQWNVIYLLLFIQKVTKCFFANFLSIFIMIILKINYLLFFGFIANFQIYQSTETTDRFHIISFKEVSTLKVLYSHETIARAEWRFRKSNVVKLHYMSFTDTSKT